MAWALLFWLELCGFGGSDHLYVSYRSRPSLIGEGNVRALCGERHGHLAGGNEIHNWRLAHWAKKAGGRCIT